MSMDQVYGIWFSWWPFFAFCGLLYGIYAAARALYSRYHGIRDGLPSHRSIRDICTLNLEELKRQATEIERLAAALERRN
jgi:hypothetical protein